MIQWQPRFRNHQEVSCEGSIGLREYHISVLYVSGWSLTAHIPDKQFFIILRQSLYGCICD